MYLGYYEEGDHCPECKDEILEWEKMDNCSCHINSPCSACTDKRLECKKCGWIDDERPNYKDVLVSPGLAMREYAPRPLDNTKIDYRTKMHTSSSQICEGVYPDGTTRDEVENIVRGSFGGRFESFGGGKFKYVAYTD